MRVSRSQAEENHRHVIATASRLFREHGFDGIGIADLMKAAGLTQGGFYKQFTSKEDLMAKAAEAAAAGSRSKWDAVIAGANGPALDALVRFYLSPQHRDATGVGCFLAALGAEAPRHGPDVRKAIESGVEAHLAQLERALGASSSDDVRARATFVLAAMVGALVLSRAVEDRDLSAQILGAVEDGILRSQSIAANTDG